MWGENKHYRNGKLIKNEYSISPCFKCYSGRNQKLIKSNELYYIQCNSCGIIGPSLHSKEDAIKWWAILFDNRRIGVTIPGLYSDGGLGYGVFEMNENKEL